MRLGVTRSVYDKLLTYAMRSKTCLHLPKVLNCTNLERTTCTSAVIVQQVKWFTNSPYLQIQLDVMSNEGKGRTAVVNYNQILEAQKDDNVLIIDVREQSEIDETGKLPGSIHIPSRVLIVNMGEVISILKNLSEQEFLQRYNKEKPKNNTRIILSCRSGKRSQIVQEELQKIGYNNTYNYAGGWLDWESNQK